MRVGNNIHTQLHTMTSFSERISFLDSFSYKNTYKLHNMTAFNERIHKFSGLSLMRPPFTIFFHLSITLASLFCTGNTTNIMMSRLHSQTHTFISFSIIICSSCLHASISSTSFSSVTTLFSVFALGILLVDDDILHFRLRESHTNISRCVGKLLRPYISDIDSFVLLPVWAFKMVLAVVASLLSAMLVFPSFRYSELQFNVTTVTRSVVTRAVVRLCYLMPLFCLGLWIKPFAKDLFSEMDVITILGREVYHETFRHWSILFYCGLRAALFKLHLQNYLELASLRVEDLRKETGRISILQLRKKVSTIFSFYGGVAVQYMAPVVVLLCLSVLMHVSSPYQRESLTPEQLEVEPSSNVFRSSGFGLSMFHGCLSFLCWWGCFTVFVASGFGSALRAYL